MGCNLYDSQSEKLYQKHCMNCHGEYGKGLKQLYPPLAGSDFMKENKNKLACIIRYGLNDKIMVNEIIYHHPMPGNKNLSEVDIVNIINYINQSWGNSEEFISLKTVKGQLNKCEQ